LAATSEAVEIYRRLAADRPDAFEPDLARYLWAAAWVRVAVYGEAMYRAVWRVLTFSAGNRSLSTISWATGPRSVGQ
jgi:hypothetical protein